MKKNSTKKTTKSKPMQVPCPHCKEMISPGVLMSIVRNKKVSKAKRVQIAKYARAKRTEKALLNKAWLLG